MTMICPECKKKIEYLIHKEEVLQFWETRLIKGEVEFIEPVEEQTNNTEGYFCPECETQLCEDNDDDFKATWKELQVKKVV